MNIKEKYDSIIFDLDGTLLDSTKVWEQVDIDFMKNHGLEITDEFVQEIKSHNFETGSVYVVEKYNLKETPKEVMDEWFEEGAAALKATTLSMTMMKNFIQELKNLFDRFSP